MRHTLLPATATLLWALNVAFVVAVHIWPIIDTYDSVQRLLIGAMIVVTTAWLMRRPGIEYRIGYRHGRKDDQE